jgi:hypothetical protein
MSSGAFASDGRHTLVGNDVYTVIRHQGNFDLIKRVPRRQDAPTPSSLVLDNLWQTSWISNEVPFISLVPTFRPFYGPLLHRLHYDDRTLPIERHPEGGWSLSPAVVEEWVALERNMRVLVYAMLECSSAPLPRNFRFWSFPGRYGYELRYRCHKHAKIIASRSRDAFIPLVAALSFALMVMDWQTEQLGEFDWRGKLLKKTGIHPQWLADLEMSAVGDFTAPRVGGIIDMTTCEFKWMLPLLWQFNMPLYLYWGNAMDLPLRAPDYLTGQGLVPERAEIDRLRSIARSQHPSTHPSTHPLPIVPTDCPRHPTVGSTEPCSVNDPNAPATSDALSTTAPHQTFPPVEKYSQQLPGEDWQSFFARRAKRDALQAQRETPQAKESRRQREENAAKGCVPGRKGARVYVWEDVDGFLVRRAAGRRNYESYWEEFGSNQRRYNSFRDEWDLCEAFDPTDQPDDVDEGDDQDGDLDAHHFPLLPEENLPHIPDGNEGVYSSSTDLQRIHGVQDPDDQVVEFDDATDALAYYRFGFVDPIGIVEEPRTKPDWKTVQKWLGNAWQVDASKTVKESICIFFGYLTSAKSLSHVPRELYDLRQDDADVHRRKIRIRCETMGDRRHYIVTPRSTEQVEFELVLASAASVVQMVRQCWGPGLVQIAHELLNRGIPFHTCIRGHPHMRLPPKPINRYGGLGYRPQDYKPDRIDYAAYESLRSRFLCSSRGRAAMLAGGIVARLAREVVRYDDVCHGPSDSVFEGGLCLWDGKASSPAYLDDQLSEDEVDLICGVYRVDTGVQTPNQLITVITFTTL